MYVDDLIRGLVKLMENEQDFVGPLNLGSPVEFSVLELAQRVLRMLPESTSRIVHKELLQDDPRQRCPDISLARRVLDWKPEVPVDEGLAKTIAYFRGVVAAER
jgi:UDP-glucuronate decarboxylase